MGGIGLIIAFLGYCIIYWGAMNLAGNPPGSLISLMIPQL